MTAPAAQARRARTGPRTLPASAVSPLRPLVGSRPVYVPAHFNEPDLATLHAFIEANGFAVLFSCAGEPFARHLPLLLERSPAPHGRLLGHVARATPQWRTADGQRVLAVFSGPHAYVSPSWYGEPDVVPTWNYVAVHATGTFRAAD